MDAMDEAPHPQGPRLAGKTFGPYQVLAEIGRGGQGVVLKVEPQGGGEPLALKLLTSSQPSSLKRFRQEAKVLLRLTHPHLPRVSAQGDELGIPYIVMELIEGEDLIAARAARGCDPAWAVQVLRPIALALDYCHGEGVVHRDLKPNNVVLEAGSQRPVLVDFGLVKRDPEAMRLSTLDQSTMHSKDGGLTGTPAFMAPEQASPQRFGDPGPATDVYGLGALLYYLLTGEAPVQAETFVQTIRELVGGPVPDPAARAPDLPAHLVALCRQALAKEPADRLPSAAAFARALEGEAPPTPEPPPAPGPSGRARVAATLLVLALLVVAWWWIRSP